MRNVLYPKLAATNIKKNGKTYFPYLLTCILTVMMFYDLLLVSTNSALDTMPGASQLRLILNFAVTITGGFSAIFLFYTNSFLVRQRKKEHQLYRGNMSNEELYEKISATLTALTTGGENNA